MPARLAARLPRPSLRVYAASSAALVAAALHHAAGATAGPPAQHAQPARHNGTRALPDRLADVASFMLHEPLCAWTLVNMAVCMLALLGTLIQQVVFGPLRVSEQQHVKDKFWNFVFYKFIFVFGVLNVQYMEEVLLWCSWFTILGFLHLLAQLCKDRFEYLSFSPTIPGWSHARLLGLLSAVLVLSAVLLLVSVGVGFYAGLNTFAFMAAECVLLVLGTLHVVVRYMLHLYDAKQAARASADAALPSAWDRRASAAYYTQLVFDMASLVLELAHHMHMLLWSNIFLSMASLVILMQLRYLFHEIQARVRKHRMYLWVLSHMDRNYPMATREEVAENSDNCAICWERMKSARKLPCSHLFHNSCLSSWLQQDTSCPTCRRTLPAWGVPPPTHRTAQPPPDPDADAQPRNAPNHFFHFDGSRYVSWLPSFSVEVTRVRLEPQQHTTSQLDAMARQVQQLFPHYPLPVIMHDLQTTHSIEVTVDNILDNRLPVPARFNVVEEEPTGPPIPDLPTPPTLAVVSGNSNAANDWNEEAQTEMWEVSPTSTRFSKNSHERERILQKRKEMLIMNARKRFIEKQPKPQAQSDLHDNTSTHVVTQDGGDFTQSS